jgi:hypothetical protein
MATKPKADPLKYLDDIQIQTESGGRQFDKNGKPLVGRYRDGTTPKPSEQAFGAGQIQIGTARETARKHGIEWNQARLLNDRDYNLKIADLHMGDLLKKYGGDRTLARAAYHSGSGTVDKAIAKYGRAGFAQGLGPEGRKYIQMGQGKNATRYNNTQGGAGVADPNVFLETLQSNLAPEVAASGGVRTTADAIFGSDGALKTRGAKVEQALTQQGDQIEILQQVTDVAQALQVESMTRKIEETRAISDEIVEGTNALKRQVRPVFEARTRIADQLDAVNTMNPLERGIRGLFDLNYDQNYLKKQLQNYDTTLQMRANDFDYINKLHETAMTEIERRYQMENALPGLAVKQTEEDLGIVGMRIQQTAGMLGSLRDMISGETQLIQAKNLAREDTLSRLDGPTVMTLMTQAQQGNGVVSFGGVEFSYNELRDRLERDEDQELNREAHRMSIASGQMEMAEKFANNLARSLTRQQAEAAIANGGMYNGIQLPQDTLQQVYKNHIETANIQAETMKNTMPQAVAFRVAADEVNRITAIHNRTKGMFGGAGIPGAKTYLQNGADMIQRLITATEQGAPPEVITALTQQIAANSKEMDTALDKALIQQSGGNKEQAGYLKAFVMGTPLDSAASIQAITYFATKGARPDGIAMTPESKAIFQQAERLVQQAREDDEKIPLDRLRQKVAAELGDYAAKAVGQARFEKVTQDIPRVAKLTGSKLAGLDSNQWRRIQTTASSEAAGVVASQIGITKQQFLKMQQTGKPLDNSENSKGIFKKYQESVATYNNLEMQLTIEGLDDIPQLQPGRRNSTLLIDLLNSPKTAEVVKQYEAGTGSASFGDYIVNPISQGAANSMIQQYGRELQTVQADLTQTTRAAARQTAASYGRDPYRRSLTILSGIDGIGQSGSKALAPFIKQVTDQVAADTNYQFGDTMNSMMVRQDEAVLQALSRAKFEDPAMETYRKLAVKNWKVISTQADGFFTTMGKLLTGEDF